MNSPCWEGDWPISQLFGVNPISYARFNLAGHNGIDLAMPAGTSLLAPFDFHVQEVAHDQEGYGWYVKIASKDGLQLLYAHQSYMPEVQVGYSGAAGETIGRSGNTGNSTGPHLHLGWRLLDAPFYRGWPFNGYLDPRPFLDRLQGGTWPPS